MQAKAIILKISKMNYKRTTWNQTDNTEQKTTCLRTQWGPLLAMFLATANKLGQRKTQLKCHKYILLTGSHSAHWEPL